MPRLAPIRPPAPRLLVLLLPIALFALGCDPIVMIPGGALSGEGAAVPASWAFTNEVDTVQLETRPEDPYSVNIWCTAANDTLYVAGSRDSRWTQNAAADPRVRLRVGDTLYDLRATEANSEADIDAFLAAAKIKYDFELEPDQRETAILFRLDPR